MAQMAQFNKPHIILVVSRGEAIRNFLYSDTIKALHQHARVTLLSVMQDEQINSHFKDYVDQIIPLNEYPERRFIIECRRILHLAHFRWIWSEVAKRHHWPLHDARAKTFPKKILRLFEKMLVFGLANRPTLEILTKLEEYLSWHYRPTIFFNKLFADLSPDLVFNCSHIHGPRADLPIRVAHRMGIPTAAFIFSWDNMTSRSRIFAPYDYFLMWNESMKTQLLEQYHHIAPVNVFVTGTPQFDFHFKSEFEWTREKLCERVGLNPSRPFILFTTGLTDHFPEEHRTLELVIRLLDEIGVTPKPQILVRTYIKGTSPEMNAMAHKNIPGVVFPPVLWEKEWITPLHEDMFVYTNLLRYCCMGINAASTVSLELMIYDKPIINLGFDPPGSELPTYSHFANHIAYDHYRPVAESGGVMVARSPEDMRTMLIRALTQPQIDSEKRRRFINTMLKDTLDGNSGNRVADRLILLAKSGA